MERHRNTEHKQELEGSPHLNTEKTIFPPEKHEFLKISTEIKPGISSTFSAGPQCWGQWAAVPPSLQPAAERATPSIPKWKKHYYSNTCSFHIWNNLYKVPHGYF